MTIWPQFAGEDLDMTPAAFMQTLVGARIDQVVTGGHGDDVACFDLYLDDGRRVSIGPQEGLPPLNVGLDDPSET